VIAAYIFLLPYVGFLLGGIPFFAIIMLLSGTRRKTTIAIAAVAIPVILFYLFRVGFKILLPHASWM
jgi:hypothetical protein